MSNLNLTLELPSEVVEAAYAVASSGWIDLPASLKRLSANDWLDVRELRGGIVEIRLGTAARKLLEEGSKTASG